MSLHAAREEDFPKLIDLVSKAFEYKEKEKVSRDFPLLYGKANAGNLYIYEENGTPMAHAGFFPAVMRLEGGKLPVAGIGGVCTDPHAQGKGLATELVETCLKKAKDQGAALAFLWTDKHDFYRKMGFELVGRQWCIELEVAALKALREKTAGGSFRLSKDRDAGFLTQSFGLQQRQVLGIQRSQEEHSALLSSGACQVFSAWSGEQLKAYLVQDKGKDLSGYIHEWAGEEAALLWLLGEATKETEAYFLLSPQFMRNEEPWIYSLEELGFPMTAQYLGMAKLLNLKPILSILGAHLKNLGLPPSALAVWEEKDGYQVEWGQSWKRKFTERELLQFLFGPDPPDQHELANVLPMRVWYWGMDSI